MKEKESSKNNNDILLCKLAALTLGEQSLEQT